MKAILSLPELLALVEIIDEHVDRNFPGVAPPRILRDLKLKFDQSVAQHRREIAIAIKSARTITKSTLSQKATSKTRKHGKTASMA